MNLSHPEYILETDDGRIRFFSSRRLPLSPVGELLEGKIKLRKMLSETTAPESKILNCRYWSHSTSTNYDMENVLIYNVGTGGFSAAAKNGIAFSRIKSYPPKTRMGASYQHLCEYSFDAPTKVSNMLAQFSFPPDRLDVCSIWLAASKAATGIKDSFSGEFGIHVDLNWPSHCSNPAHVLKPIFDGIIAALQSDSRITRDAIDRLGQKCRQPFETIEYLLCKRRPVLLAPIRSAPLLRLTPTNIAWNPADHLCAEGMFTISKSSIPRCGVSIYKVPSSSLSSELHFSETVNTLGITRASDEKSPKRNHLLKASMRSDLDDFAEWIAAQPQYKDSTKRTFLSDARRIENKYGPICEHFDRDHLISLEREMIYSVEDRRNGRKNPSRLDIRVGPNRDLGDSIYNNLRAGRSALNMYRQFRERQKK